MDEHWLAKVTGHNGLMWCAKVLTPGQLLPGLMKDVKRIGITDPREGGHSPFQRLGVSPENRELR